MQGFEHVGVSLDFFVTGVDRRYVNCNVSVGLGQRVVDLIRKSQDIVLNFTLGIEGRQVDLLDNCLEVAEPVLRFSVSLWGLCLHHLNFRVLYFFWLRGAEVIFKFLLIINLTNKF